MAIRTTGIDHMHINVRSIDGFLELFGRLFELDSTMVSLVESIGAYNTTVRLRGVSSDQPFLDVFEPARPGCAVSRHIERRGEGVAILSFGVDDIDAAADHAATCGLREVSRIGFPGVMKQVQFNPADTFGFMLELVQYEPGHEAAIAEIQRAKAAGEPVPGLSVRDHKG